MVVFGVPCVVETVDERNGGMVVVIFVVTGVVYFVDGFVDGT